MAENPSDQSSIPPVERVRQEVERWMETVRSTGERAMESLGLFNANRSSEPTVDLIELADEIIAQIDLPGIPAETVDLKLVGNMLTITVTSTRPEFPPEAKYHLRERFEGQFQRAIPLPAAVDSESIQAETRDGRLTVTLKKANPTSSRSIHVSRGAGTPS